MATHLKTRKSAEETKAADQAVCETVETIIADIEENGDKAVRALSEKFDKWSPENFRLTQEEIDGLVAGLAQEVISDIEFAQTQVRNFATAQKAALQDVTVESLPGITLGHKNIPVNSIGCYVPGGRYPMVASAHMSIVTARVAGVNRIIACTPPTD
ncbi:MAG: histidinol dehydrogenase, partial [Alphaproteobacteria bacterium]|nr:histidinol dehydrogenase [Alphaproteobacteria bacterium]